MRVSSRALSGVDIVMMSWGQTYVFNESALVLEGVTLGEEVELVVEVLVNLSGGTVLDEETTEDTETAHPDDLAIRNPQSANNPMSSSSSIGLHNDHLSSPL